MKKTFKLLVTLSALFSLAFAQVDVEFANERYEVQPGDSLGLISQKTGVDVDTLITLNNISDPNQIEVGQILILPSKIFGEGGAGNVAAVVPSVGTSRPVNQDILTGMNQLLSASDYSSCTGETYFFVSRDTAGLVVEYLDALKASNYTYVPLFQVAASPTNTITLARVTGNGVNIYSMIAINDGASLMLCDAN